MADWNKHNMPSGPMSDPDKNNGEGAESPRDPLPRPDPFAPLSETPTIDAGKSSYDIDKTKVSKKAPSRSDQPIPGFPHAPAINQPELPPDLAESLHTAAVSQQTGEPKKASSLEDMNTLLKPLGFECHRVLGTGGMGSVFLATDTKLQRRVAIKVLLPKLSGNAQFTQMFLKEAETVAQFGHSNIVQIYSIHLVHNMYFIVMEYVEGTTIRARIKREGRISEEETLRIMDQVTRALSEMHQRGILHRDIKPQNILITSDGVPKVADFGLAISLREAEGAAAAGTPTYMAPEQARGEIPTVASDIYSLGVVMYMMLSGKLPYRSSSVIDVMKEISAGNKIDLEKVAPDVSRPLIRLVGKSLETRPSDRFKTMGEYNAAIRNAWLEYRKPGLKPMIPRVKRAAWMYLAPPACLLAGMMLGYLVHNPVAKQTSISYEQAFRPRVEHLKRALVRVMDSESDQGVKIHYSGMITYLDEAMKKNDPEYLARAIGDAEFAVDWHEVQAMLLHLKSHGVLTAEAQLEAKTLWEAAETFKRESLSEKPEAREEARKAKDIFYQHRSRLFDLLKTRTAP